ncbi:MAG TPA: Clp protease N-terminal domain-containing protein [Blastocatellia bacterium]|nr:Clp protease N-terminal domain-containing protein [Blastocatellia bacterium]
MFEKYTEKARRAIFFARYEASQFGSERIEAEHILLGVLREDSILASRFFNSRSAVEDVRREIEGRTGVREGVPTSVDMPLSVEAKNVLKFVAEESERLKHRHIGTEHLLLGLLCLEGAVAAEILQSRGLKLEEVREALKQPIAAEESDNEPALLAHKFARWRPADRYEKWSREVAEACEESVLFTQAELIAEFQRVAALRQFSADAEARGKGVG